MNTKGSFYVAAADFFRNNGFLVMLSAVILVFAVKQDSFFTVTNLMGLLHSSSPIAVLAVGLALVVMTGKLDISIGSVAFLSSAIGAVLMFRQDVSPVIAIPLMLMVGALCGLINGLVCNYLNVNPLITTMGAMFVYRGIALQLTGSRNIGVSEGMHAFGNYRVGPIFIDVLIVALILVAFHVLHSRTTFGRCIMALGNSSGTADKLGIRTKVVSIATFVISGLCASLGGIFMVCQIGSVTTLMGTGVEFTAIAAIVIGGVSLFGGEGRVFPSYVLGIISLALIENGLNHMGASPYVYPFIRGGIILVAMYADSLRRSATPRNIKFFRSSPV